MPGEVTGPSAVHRGLSGGQARAAWLPRRLLRALLPALLAATLAPGCGAQESTAPAPTPTPASIKARGELRVGTINSPTTYYLGTHGPDGLEYQLASGFARSLGVKLRLEQLPDRRALRAALTEGKVDLLAAHLSDGPEWRDVALAAAPYDEVVQHWVYRRGRTRPTTLQEVAAGRIVVGEESNEAAYLAAWAPRAGVPLEWIEIPRDGGIDALDAVGSGNADVALVDGHDFAFARALHPEIGIAFSLPRRRPVQWLLPRGATELRAAVDAWFAAERRSGRLAALSRVALQAPGQMRRVTAREFRSHLEERLPGLQPLFEQASVQSGVDWRLLAALAYQESQWNPRALSPNGARGIMMLMPETAAAVGVRDPFDPRESILGGARYFLRVLAQIPARIPEPDRSWFAIAAYNMGYGHLEDARVITQMKGGDPDSWAAVRENLPLLSDEAWYVRVKNGYARGWEAQYTVDRVRAFANVLEWRATARHQPGALETPAELRAFDAGDDGDEAPDPAQPATATSSAAPPVDPVSASPATPTADGAAPGK